MEALCYTEGEIATMEAGCKEASLVSVWRHFGYSETSFNPLSLEGILSSFDHATLKNHISAVISSSL